MIGLIVAAALGQVSPVDNSALLAAIRQPNDALTACLKSSAIDLYNPSDDAETIARGARSVCGAERIAVSKAMFDYFSGRPDKYEKPVFEQIDNQLEEEALETARLFVLGIRSGKISVSTK